jgi:lysophospholipase L1-like esterase
MNTSLKFIAPAFALWGLALGGCQADIDAPATASAGTADFTTYIAVGNSLTAGYQSGGLSRAGQLQSYPSILATQFAGVGGGAFNQPLFSEAQADGSGYLKLLLVNGSLAPVTPSAANQYLSEQLAVVPGSLKTGTNLLAKYTGTDNQNLGVPGIKVADVTTNGYGFNNPLGFNPFFERLLPSAQPQGLANYLQYVQERVATLHPTFFTNWLGNNDVLGYASSGGASDVLTPVADFTTKYNQVLTALTANGAKGLVATIPDVTNVPLFTTVPTATVLAQINGTAISPAVNAAVAAQLGMASLPAGSKLTLYITTGTGTKREATADDLLLLPASSYINTASTTSPFPNGIGILIPGASAPVAGALAAASNALPSSLVLDATEKASVLTRTSELNSVIRASAATYKLALFDSNTFFRTVAASGFATNGVNNSTTYVSGNLFSLDGVHPTPRGYAIVANEMLQAINTTYGSSFRGVNPNEYSGIIFPL